MKMTPLRGASNFIQPKVDVMHNIPTTDVIVIGAGIVGAACASALAQRGQTVRIVDAQFGGATWAGMGHLVLMDDHPAELAIGQASQEIWRTWARHIPSTGSHHDCAYTNCGTLWVAETEADMAIAHEKYERLRAQDVPCELVNAHTLSNLEPTLRTGLLGGLKVSSDSTVYAPNVVRWLLTQPATATRLTVTVGEVTQIDGGTVILRDGQRLHATHIVLAAGAQCTTLCPELPVRPKKGHLLITDRYPQRIQHQLVELGYAASAHQTEGSSVAFNVQPRPTGQLLIGSSRQFDSLTPVVETDVLARMLQRASAFIPSLARMNAIRAWTGFRAASPDGLPLIGAHPWRERLWLAVGHEGLGVTTAPATAELLAALMLNTAQPIAAEPYSPQRFDLTEPNKS